MKTTIKILNSITSNNRYTFLLKIEVISSNKSNPKVVYKVGDYNKESNDITIDGNTLPLNKIEDKFENNENYFSKLFNKSSESFKKVALATVTAAAISTSSYGQSIDDNPYLNSKNNINIEQHIKEHEKSNKTTNETNEVKNSQRELSIENIKDKIATDFYNKHHKDLDTTLTKDDIKKSIVVSLGVYGEDDSHAEYVNDIDTVQQQQNIKNLMATYSGNSNETLTYSELDKNSIEKTGGVVKVVAPLEILEKIESGKVSEDYKKDFDSMMLNVGNHELSHLLLYTDEIQAVQMQDKEFGNKEFISDLNQYYSFSAPELETRKDELKYEVSKTLSQYNFDQLKLGTTDEEQKQYQESYQRIKKILEDEENQKEYLLNDTTLKNTQVYSSGNREPNNTYYTNPGEYLSVATGVEAFSLSGSGAPDEIAVGPYNNMLLFLETQDNLSEKDKEVAQKLIAYDLYKTNVFYSNDLTEQEKVNALQGINQKVVEIADNASIKHEQFNNVNKSQDTTKEVSTATGELKQLIQNEDETLILKKKTPEEISAATSELKELIAQESKSQQQTQELV
jgi:hypothetical protein